MKIISNFKDYYDIATNQDNSTLYERYSVEDDLGGLLTSWDKTKSFNQHTYTNREIGIFNYTERENLLKYFEIIINPIIKPLKQNEYSISSRYFTGLFIEHQGVDREIDSIETLIVNIADKSYFGLIFNLKTIPNKYSLENKFFVWQNSGQLKFKKDYYKSKRDIVVNNLNQILEIPEVETDINVKLNCAVSMFYIYDSRSIKLVKNPKLIDFNFFNRLDAYSCYQQIEMFINGVLAPSEKEAKPLTDKEKIQQYGFDVKSSFRKDKQK